MRAKSGSSLAKNSPSGRKSAPSISVFNRTSFRFGTVFGTGDSMPVVAREVKKMFFLNSVFAIIYYTKMPIGKVV